MNQLTSNNNLTMSSREIAELTGVRQDNVKRTMLALKDKGVISFTQIEENTNSAGRPPVLFMVDKRNSYIVVAQLSPEFTAKLVDRWQELEKCLQPTLPSNYLEALEHLVSKEKLLLEQAPKVAFVDKYVEAETGSKTFRQVCKLLNAKENQFRAFLVEEKIMYRLGGDWAAYAQHIDAGRFATKTGVSDYGHAYSASNFTAKGIEWIAAKWAVYQLKGE